MPQKGPSRRHAKPRVRALAWGIAALLLTALFVARGFPYERLSPLLTAAVARSTPLTLHVQELAPSLSLLGPGIRATDLRITAPDGAVIRVDALRLRPAWSLCWLRLRPCFRLALALAGGSADGTLGSEPSFAGELAGIDLAQLPLATLWPGGALAGRLDATVDLSSGAGGPEGSIALQAREGSIGLPRLPLPLPFETLSARLALGGDAMVRIEELELLGPGLELRGEGQVGRAADFAQAPLDLRIEFEAQAPLANGLRSFGVRVGRDGRGALQLTGTPTRPVVE